MILNNKLEFLSQIEKKNLLNYKEVIDVIILSLDKDEVVRSRVATVLVCFENRITENLLLRLAKDNNSMVRTEAYDSLSVFSSKKVLRFLEKAIWREKSEIACCYAIMSWTDVSLDLENNFIKNYQKVCQIKKFQRIKNSEHCLLSCYRAQYIYGNVLVLGEIMGFLQSKDYHIRCSVISILREILNKDNREIIQEELENLLTYETALSVRKSVEDFLAEMLLQ